jgi:hypothetical protein
MKFQLHTPFNGSATSTQELPATDLSDATGYQVFANWTVTTPAAAQFADTAVDATEDTITIEAHGMTTGLKGQVTTDTTLPTGISAATDYYVIAVDDDTIQLAASLADALAGTAIDIEDAGTGPHTFTATAIAGGVLKLQSSVDGTNWSDISGETSNITATGSKFYAVQANAYYAAVRAHLTLTAGQISLTVKVSKK